MPVYVDVVLPGVRAEGYAGMIGMAGPLLTRAPGFLAHAAGPHPDGYHVLELWRSEREWQAFVEQVIAPACREAGITPVVRVEQLERLITPLHAGLGSEGERTGTSVQPFLRDEGPSFRLGPLSILVKEDGTHTRQTLAVAEFRGQGFRIPPHMHTEHDENIYVLSGELGVMLGERTFQAPAGTSFTIPIGVPHSVWNESDEEARFLNTIVPARYLDYFHEMALVAREGKLAAPEDMRRVMGKFGLVPLMPPAR